MWVRNGNSMIYQSYTYKSSFFLDFFHHDTFLQQCSIVLDPSKFIENAVRRFQFFPNWIQQQKVVRVGPEIKLAEDFFRVIIHLLCDRTRLGTSLATNVRREIVHQLAVQDQP